MGLLPLSDTSSYFYQFPFEEASTYMLYKQVIDYKNEKPFRTEKKSMKRKYKNTSKILLFNFSLPFKNVPTELRCCFEKCVIYIYSLHFSFLLLLEKNYHPFLIIPFDSLSTHKCH